MIKRHRASRRHSQERRKIERRKAKRAGFPTALVICEGSQTEPNYLRGLADSRNINLANLHIDGCEGVTDPKNLLKRAKEKFAISPDYDTIFIVLDGDQEISQNVRNSAKSGPMKADKVRAPIFFVQTTPCFEYWLLLHFEYTTRLFQDCSEVIDVLKAHLPNYEKNDLEIFRKLEAGFDAAYGNAQRANQAAAQAGSTSPISEMPTLVDALNQMIRS